MTDRVAIYCRISRDRVGAGLGVERQEQDCRELAARLGWTVVEVFTDNDVSAYSGKVRPDYRAMLDAIKCGRIDAIVAWHADRLHRRPLELEEFIAVCEAHAVAVQTCRAGEIDLSTPSGRMVARMLGAAARHEVEHMIDKQKRQKLQAATSGKYRGGRRPFGYERDGRTVRDDEAKIVADCTDRVLAGESLHSVARDLNERGIPTSTGSKWKGVELRKMLMRARNAGLIERESQVLDGVAAAWPAIVDPIKWMNLHRLLTTPGRKRPISADRVWIGSGIYRCGVCGDGTTMCSAATRSTSRGGVHVPAYRCRTGSHLTRTARYLDDFVTRVVIERLSRPDARLLLAPAARRVDVEALHARRDDVSARLTELATLYAQGVVTGAQLAEGTRLLRAEGEELEAAMSVATAASPLAGFADVDDVRGAWDAATVGRRKAVIDALMTITLVPAPKGRPAGWVAGEPYFDPRAVHIAWRTAES